MASLLSVNFILHAADMVPETSLLIIDEATHSGTMNMDGTLFLILPTINSFLGMKNIAEPVLVQSLFVADA